MSATPATAATGGVGRLWEAADTALFLAVLNVMVLLMTLAGGVVLGLAPAVAAAVSCSRARLRGEIHPWVRRFVGLWREQFVRANVLQAPAALLLALLGVNYLALAQTSPSLRAVFGVTAGLVLVLHVLVVTMEAHYDLRVGDCLRQAGRFAVRFPGAPLLLAATLTLIAVVTALLPGLLMVLSIGAAIYLCTALCLSFFATNDRKIA